MKIEHVAWTGGSSPEPFHQIGFAERDYVRYLYKQQVREWSEFWKEPCPQEQRDIFWKRARYDAHATFRAHERSKQNGEA